MMNAVFLLATLSAVTFADAKRTFTDDIGRKFEFEGQPTFAVRAGLGGTTLLHYGKDILLLMNE